jgi:hypothetical protein
MGHVTRAFLTTALLAASAGCAPAARPEPAAPPPPAPASDPAVPKLREQIAALEARVTQLEHASAESASKRAAAPSVPRWSCSAKCGRRSTQTTEFEINYERITSSGTTAAEAYERLNNACRDTIYERVEGQRMVGGEMKNVCIREAGSATD